MKLLRVPIRVLPLYEEFFNEAVVLCNDTTEELTPANPFLEIQQKESSLNLALQSLQVCLYPCSHECGCYNMKDKTKIGVFRFILLQVLDEIST